MKILGPNKSFLFVSFSLAASLIFPGCSKDTTPTDVPKVPTIATTAVTNITSTNAVSGGTISQAGSSDIKSKGVCWSISQNPDTTATHTNEGAGQTTFTSNITNLIPNTVYYVRAYATNSAGVGYGNVLSFTTAQISCENYITYEGKIYQTVLINSQCWFRQNLNVGTRINGDVTQTNNNVIEKHCYNDEESNCDFFGALYQWDEMMQYVTAQGSKGICPEGWHIPMDDDWTTLIDYLGGDSIAGGKIKQAGLDYWASPNTGATNSSGFSALGAGQHNASGFDGIMLYTFFWSSAQDVANPDHAWSRTPYNTGKDIYRGSGLKVNSFSVRCLKN
ncbi:MAG: hypothetical protein NTU51_11085 [Bacteroidetes bacterium]|nr:hypothetical protein [Bacteroidota bacterium]